MHISEFEYDLDQTRIAQTPVEPRDSSRLMVAFEDRPVEHRHVRDLPEYLEPGDLLVVNDTRVLPARLRLRRSSGGAVEVLLLEPLDADSRRWRAMVRPGGRLKTGEFLRHEPTGREVIFDQRFDNGDTFVVELCHDGDAMSFLAECGDIPLPPYVTASLGDRERYQTVYARRPASTAAPTAGLHLTPRLMAEISRIGVDVATVELVVGMDTFRPIQVDDPLQHTMHSEFYSMTNETTDMVQRATRVVAVGTTSARCLESAATSGELSGRTNLFIHRGYEWKSVDLLMTNFHMPRSTLLLLIDAFIGPRWRDLYESAMVEGYRFLSFGDAMLVDRHGT